MTMPYYLSQHPDYTDAGNPREVDCPAEPRFIEAKNAEEAARKNFEIDLAESGDPDATQDDINGETMLVLLDPLFDKMRQAGWTVIPPPEIKGE